MNNEFIILTNDEALQKVKENNSFSWTLESVIEYHPSKTPENSIE